jgi:multicomponent Na+:H+ antiporter subunit C
MQEILDFLDSPEVLKIIFFSGITALIIIGIFGLMKKKNIIKMIMCISIIETAINLLLIAIIFQKDKTAPIFTDGKTAESMVDPIPQALVLTAIVIGVAVLALGLSFAVKYYKLTGKTNISKMKELRR